MKLHEVLTLPLVENGEVWFRPVGWPQGYAYCVKDGACCATPGQRGAVPGLIPFVAELCGEWEAVVPRDVLRKTRDE